MAIYNNEQDLNVKMWENQNKNSYILYATIRIEIESELDLENAIDEFSQGCYYKFPDTENCKVVNTAWEDTTL